MSTQDTFEWIERYLQGELDADELASFENQMNENQEFAEKVNVYLNLNKHLKFRTENAQETEKLKSTLQKLGNQHISHTPKIINLFQKNRVWLAAASIALIIGLFYFQGGKPVYGDFAQHPAMELTVRGSQNENLEKAQTAFNHKNYETALELLDNALTEQPENAELQLYRGICLLETNRLDGAKESFNTLKNNILYKNTALWYLALTSLKEKDYTSCKAFLKQIDPDSSEGKKAKKLLRKL